MKKTILFASILFTAMGCQHHDKATEETSVMKDVYVSYSGIEFSKSVNDAEKHYVSEDNRLSINGLPKTNYFNAPDGSRTDATAPILLTEVDNTRPFTFTAKLQSPIENRYDAGAVYLYLSNNNWLKYAFELDEHKRRRVVTVRTRETSDDNNHDIIEQDFVYMKISSDSKQIGLYYSLDGANWNLARLFKNEYPQKLWIGVSSQSPGGQGNVTLFEEMSLTGEHVKNFRLGI